VSVWSTELYLNIHQKKLSIEIVRSLVANRWYFC